MNEKTFTVTNGKVYEGSDGLNPKARAKYERRRELIEEFMRSIDRAKFGCVVALRTGDPEALEQGRRRLVDAMELYEKRAKEVEDDPA